MRHQSRERVIVMKKDSFAAVMGIAALVALAIVLTWFAPASAQAVCDSVTLPTTSVCGPNNGVFLTFPTTNTDGSPLNDYATARVIFGPNALLCTPQGLPTTGSTVRSLGALGVPPTPLPATTVRVGMDTLNFPNGQLFIAAQVLDNVGNISACTGSVQFTYNGTIPNGPAIKVGS